MSYRSWTIDRLAPYFLLVFLAISGGMDCRLTACRLPSERDRVVIISLFAAPDGCNNKHHRVLPDWHAPDRLSGGGILPYRVDPNRIMVLAAFFRDVSNVTGPLSHRTTRIFLFMIGLVPRGSLIFDSVIGLTLMVPGLPILRQPIDCQWRIRAGLLASLLKQIILASYAYSSRLCQDSGCQSAANTGSPRY